MENWIVAVIVVIIIIIAVGWYLSNKVNKTLAKASQVASQAAQQLDQQVQNAIEQAQQPKVTITPVQSYPIYYPQVIAYGGWGRGGWRGWRRR